MQKLKILVLTSLIFLTGRVTAQDPNWNSWITIPPNPSPYISDWENNPNSITYSLQYFGETETEVFLDIGVVSEQHGEVFNGRSQPIVFNMGAELREISSIDIIDWNSIHWNNNIEAQAVRTGRFPEGDYFACIIAVGSENNFLTESCINFTINYPEAPYLISPIDDEIVNYPQPIFQWTPVLDYSSLGVINYLVKIVEMLPGQTAEQAILANPVHFELKTPTTTISYLPSAQSFEEGKHYAWQIQALDENEIPVANNDGRSEIWSFQYKSVLTLLTDIGFVNDGISNDEDYTNSTSELSANWETVSGTQSYLYSIGTTEGGTDIVSWTESGLSNSFTKSALSLSQGKKYYVSVKTENNDGSYGSVKTSDGITIDTKTPTSQLEIEIPSGKISAEYTNNSNFKISWSASESISPVSFDVQYKYENDLTWTTWLANTQLKFSTFSSDVIQGDGKYSFRVQAKNQAGNVESPKSKPDDQTLVDTKTPSSKIKALGTEQTLTSFLVEWSGTDLKPGSGIEYYDVQAKEDNGNWTDWLTKQTSTSGSYQAKAGHKYSFRCSATDNAGNIEQYPSSPDAITKVSTSSKNGLYLTAYADPDSAFHDNSGMLSFFSSESYYYIELGAVGSASNAVVLDSVKLKWYKEDYTLIKTESKKLTSPISLTGGQTKKVFLSAKEPDPLPSTSEKRLVLLLEVDYTGKDLSGLLVKAETQQLKSIHSLIPLSKPLVLNVDVIPSSISYAPGWLSNKIDVKLELEGPSNTIVKIDKVINYWYKKDKTNFATLSDQISPSITIKSGEKKTRKDVVMTIDQTSLNNALGGKSMAEYYVELEYIGKDQTGKTVKGITKVPLWVTYYSALSNYTSLTIIPSPLSFDYYPGVTKQEIDLDFSWTGFTSVTLDSYYETLIDQNGKKTVLPAVSLVGNELKFNPGTKTTTVYNGGNVIQGVPDLDTTITKNLPVTLDEALKGKPAAKYTLTLTYSGKDGNGKKVSAESKPIILNVFSQPDAELTVNVTPTSNTFNSNNLVKNWQASISFKGKVDVTIDSIYALWYISNGNFIKRNPNRELSTPIKIKAPSGTFQQSVQQTISDLGRYNMMKDGWGTSKDTPGKKIVNYDLEIQFVGKDALGRKISGESNRVKVVLEEPKYPLTVLAIPEKITTTKEMPKVSYIIKSNFNSDVTSHTRTTRIKMGTKTLPYKGYENIPLSKFTATDEIVGFSNPYVIPANGQYVDAAHITLNLPEILKGKKSAECIAEVEYDGKTSSGTAIKGKVYVPITVGKPKIVQEQDTLLTQLDDFVIIPKVAVVKAYKNLTTITKQGTKTVLNGPVQLILIPDPFDSTKIAVEATDLTFSPKQGVKKTWEVKAGSFSEEGSALKKDLFKIYKGFIEVNKISYDHKRTDKMLIEKAHSKIPGINDLLFFTNLVIDKSGLNLKIKEQKITKYGFTFTLKDIQKKGDVFSLTAGIKLPVINKTLTNKEYAVQLIIVDKNNKKTIKVNSLSNKPFQIIANTNYLNFKTFKFVEKANDNWVLEVEVTSDDLPLYKKLGLGPITTTFTYEKSGKMSGKLEPIKETKTGYDSNDISVIKIGKFGAIDLTYLGLTIAMGEEISTVNSKADTSFVFDPDNSFFGISADLHLPFAGKVLGDASGIINIGDYKKPGIKIDFNGKVSSQTIGFSQNKKLDLGPVFLKLTKLAVTPEPFSLAISGGFGIDMENVFSGEITIVGLKIDSDGKFTNFNQVVKGGDLSILKIVKFGIDNLEYKSAPSKLSFTGDDGKSNSLQVDSYFRLKGANLSIGKSGAAGGGFDELLVYEYQGNTNFILDNGKLSVKDAIDLTIDIQYVKKQNEEYLSVGGDATIVNKWGATVYGKIGKRDGDATWGFFAAVKNLNISLVGPLMLDKIGAGFFYRPTKKDINKIITVAGIKPIKIDKAFSYAKPKGSNDFKCAVFINAGLLVSEKKVVEGQAMITITENYFRLDANVKALDGKATGSAFLNINWANEYAEGKFQFGIDFVVIKAEEKDNNFQFYAYSKSKWGVMGKTNIKCFFIDTKSQFYVGEQGFLFDFGFGYSLDIGVLEGGINLEVMAWWRKDVNWGIYAQGKAWGEFLWGLAGGKIAIEGALISPPFTIYVAGELTLTLCYVEVFDGRAWIALGEKGFDGGTGGDNKYDKLISDARNIGKQMKKDMEKLANDLKKAREALYKLNEQQRIAAGKALMKLSAWSGGKGIGAVFVGLYKVWHQQDLYGKLVGPPLEPIASSDVAQPNLKKVFDMIWNPKAPAFLQIETTLKQDSAAIAKAISEIETKESELKTLLDSHGDLLNEKLPTLSELGKLKSPVTKPVLTSSTINGKSIQVFNYNFSPADANNLKSNVFKGKTELDAYRKKLLSMVTDYVNKLNEIKSILAGGSSSVADISKDYAVTYDKVSRYTTRFMDYLNGRQNWAASESGKIVNLKSDINKALTTQAVSFSIPFSTSNSQPNNLYKQRMDLIKALVKLGKEKEYKPPEDGITLTNYVDMGMELYYHIPQKGFSSVDNEMGKARQTFVKYFKASNDIYQAKWNNFTVQCDKVYSRQAKLYTILYDLFDQLSLEAGTRKLEGKSSQTLLVNTGDNLINQGNQMAFVNQAGLVSTSSNSAQYAAGGMTFGSSQIGQTSFQQAIQSGAINTSTGNNISQSQTYKGKVTKKGEWAKGWDFEKERKTVKKILQVPKIVQLSGKAISDKNTNGYSKLTLNWKGKHLIGIAEYSFSIEGYSDPVNLSDITSGTSGNQILIAEFIGDESADQLMVSDYSAGALTQLTGDNFSGNINSADISLDGQLNTSATYNTNFSGAGETIKAWRTVGNKQNLVMPFFESRT